MNNRLMFRLVIVFFSFSITSCAVFQPEKGKKTAASATPEAKGKNGIKPYDKVITKNAKSDIGLFTVHQIEDDYFYEIPDSLFNREMLMVTRIAKTASGIGFGGGKQEEKVLRWEKRNKNVLLRVVSHSNFAADSLPIHEAVVNSNFAPILYSFDIEAFRRDSVNNSTVIKVTDLFKKDVQALGFPERNRKNYKITRLDESRSYIDTIRSYPENIEVRHVKTYLSSEPPSNASTASISVKMSNSMILLPKVPMERRYFDERVGWFTSSQTDYGL